MVHKGSAEPWVPGMQGLKMDLALARLLAPEAPLALLRALESGRLLLLVVEEAHHC